MQSPFFRPADAFFAVSQSLVARQSACFSQISPVRESVTVPFPQSLYLFALSMQGPAAVANGIRADASGVDFMDASVVPAGAMKLVASPSSMISTDSLRDTFPIRSPIPLLQVV